MNIGAVSGRQFGRSFFHNLKDIYMKNVKIHDSYSETWHHADHIDGWLTKREGKFLYTLASAYHEIPDIIEIGSYKGKSTMIMASALAIRSFGRIIAIDPHQGDITLHTPKMPATLDAFRKTIRDSHLEKYVVLMRKTSIAASKHYLGKTDLLFIDGLHDYEHASEDFSAWFPFVIPGGIIVFHDAYCGIPGVGAAAMETLSRRDISFVGAVGSMLYVVKGASKNWWARMVFTFRCQLIWIGQHIYGISGIPMSMRMVICHRIIKILLYTPIDQTMKEIV